MYTSKGLWKKSKRREILNIRLWELSSGKLIDLTKINYIGEIYTYTYWETKRKEKTKWKYDLCLNNKEFIYSYETEDEAKLSRFNFIERWDACLNIIYPQQQEWCPESGTFSNSNIGKDYKKREDKYEGYRESEH